MQFKNTHVTFSFQAKLTQLYIGASVTGTHELHCVICVYDIQLKDALPHGPELSGFDTS